MSAVKLGLFTQLAGGERSEAEIQHELGLHDRSLYDFLDTLVALGFLEREDLGRTARYRNAPDAEAFLVAGKPNYVGGFLEMANDRLYPFWGDLEEGLRTGEPQNEIKHGDEDFFDSLYEDPARLTQFMAAMEGVQMGAFVALAQSFDFSPYATLLDAGGASGALSIQIALHHEHMRCISADLPVVEPIARERIEKAGLTERVEVRSLDFWNDPFPSVYLVTMGNILHDWDAHEQKRLIRKAYEALRDDGALIVIEHMIDDDRRVNAFGLMMSLNMLIETRDGFNFTGADFDALARQTGFRATEVLPLAGPTSAAIAHK